MKLIKVKTAELTGAALDWAVAKAIGFSGDGCADGVMRRWVGPSKNILETVFFCDGSEESITESFSPSSNWAHGGPLIDDFCPYFNVGNGQIRCSVNDTVQFGATYLIAFCRALVASKLADVNGNVMIPAELVREAA